MAEESGPLVGENFTDVQWRAIFGGEPGIVGDADGSAYNLTLGAGTDDAQLGSTTQDSISVVAGYMHRIPQGQTQAVTIPPSTNPVGRTDIIVVRFDSGSFTSPPGPCRLHRVAGVEGSAVRPSLDESPPGVEDFPLWAVTRKGNGTVAEGLNQAARMDLRRRTGPALDVPAGEVLPPNVPLGTRAARGNEVYRRTLNPSGTAVWVLESTSGEPAFTQVARTSQLGSDTQPGTWGFYGVGSVLTAGNSPSTHLASAASTAVNTSKASVTFRTEGVYAVAATIQLACGASFRARLTGSSTGQQGTRGLVDEQEANAGQVSLQISDTRFFAAGGKFEPTFTVNRAVRVQSWSMWATRLS